jgi:hypothetical protein
VFFLQAESTQFIGYVLLHKRGGTPYFRGSDFENRLKEARGEGCRLKREVGQADTPLNIKTDGQCLIVTPAQTPARREKFQTALEEGNRRYGKTLKRLA